MRPKPVKNAQKNRGRTGNLHGYDEAWLNAIGVRFVSEVAQPHAVVQRVFAGNAPSVESIEAMLSGTTTRAKVTEVVVGKNSVHFSAVLRDSETGEDVATISREFKRRGNGNLTGHHAGFHFASLAETGRGNATASIGQSLRVYKQLGVSAVTVDADNVGRYTWASFGFDWNRAATRTKMEGAFLVFLVEHGVGADDARDIASFESMVPWRIAMYTRNGEPLGKYFLLTGPQWSGKLSLDSSEASFQWARKKFGL